MFYGMLFKRLSFAECSHTFNFCCTDDDIVDTSGEVKTAADYYGEVASEE